MAIGFGQQSGFPVIMPNYAGIAAQAQRNRAQAMQGVDTLGSLAGGAIGGAIHGSKMGKHGQSSIFGGQDSALKGALEGAASASNPQFASDAKETKALRTLYEKYGTAMGDPDAKQKAEMMSLGQLRGEVQGFAVTEAVRSMKEKEAARNALQAAVQQSGFGNTMGPYQPGSPQAIAAAIAANPQAINTPAGAALFGNVMKAQGAPATFFDRSQIGQPIPVKGMPGYNVVPLSPNRSELVRNPSAMATVQELKSPDGRVIGWAFGSRFIENKEDATRIQALQNEIKNDISAYNSTYDPDEKDSWMKKVKAAQDKLDALLQPKAAQQAGPDVGDAFDKWLNSQNQ